ncbi:MAG: hypothetical protein RLZZ628_115 [Bacteroidota bacterium]|jgi:hypothetical protein
MNFQKKRDYFLAQIFGEHIFGTHMDIVHIYFFKPLIINGLKKYMCTMSICVPKSKRVQSETVPFFLKKLKIKIKSVFEGLSS